MFSNNFCCEKVEKKNNHLTFLITNKTNYNFYVHTFDIEDTRTDGPLQSGSIYRYQRSFSHDELLIYKSLNFERNFAPWKKKPWKKWFHVIHGATRRDFVVDILLAHPNSDQLLAIELSHLKEAHKYIRHDPQAEPFNICVHLILKNAEYLGEGINFQHSTLEITENNPL